MTESVDVIHSRRTEPQYFINLYLRVTGSTIIEQPQGIGDTQWGENLAEESQGQVFDSLLIIGPYYLYVL